MSGNEPDGTQEIAKAVGEGVSAARELGAFFDKVLGGGLVQLGGAFSDWTRTYRYKNLLRLRDRVEEIHKERRLEGKTIPIPPRYAFPILEAAAIEDDDTLRDIWARLIANATDPGRKLHPNRIFGELLKSMEPIDARVISFLASKGWGPTLGEFNEPRLCHELEVSREEMRLSLQNLARLGCIESASLDGSAILYGDPNAVFRVSQLGHSLLNACAE